MTGQRAAPGRTQDFVLGRGFQEFFGNLRLIDEDGFGRGFLELTADPDHSGFRPDEAYENILGSLKPGLTIRLLQIRWPAPGPRLAFYENILNWEASLPDGLPAKMHADLLNNLRQTPLPYQTRTILEVVLRSPDDLEWFEAAGDLLNQRGISARELSAARVKELAHFIFHPEPG